MLAGVIIYAIIVGSLTSMLTSEGTYQENLQQKLKAFEQFAQECNMDMDIRNEIK